MDEKTRARLLVKLARLEKTPLYQRLVAHQLERWDEDELLGIEKVFDEREQDFPTLEGKEKEEAREQRARHDAAEAELFARGEIPRWLALDHIPVQITRDGTMYVFGEKHPPVRDPQCAW